MHRGENIWYVYSTQLRYLPDFERLMSGNFPHEEGPPVENKIACFSVMHCNLNNFSFQYFQYLLFREVAKTGFSNWLFFTNIDTSYHEYHTEYQHKIFRSHTSSQGINFRISI